MISPKYLLENVEKYPNEPALSVKDSSGNWAWFSLIKGSNNWTFDVIKIRRVADINDY